MPTARDRCASSTPKARLEFKVLELAPDGNALQQIKARGYDDKYRAERRTMHLIGIDFSRERRSVVGFEVETLAAAR